MTKAIFFIIFSFSFVFATNTVSTDRLEKKSAQRVKKGQYHNQKSTNRYQQRSDHRVKNREYKSKKSYRLHKKHPLKRRDRNFKKRDTVKRNFRTHNEFRRIKKQHYNNTHSRKHYKSPRSYYQGRRVYKQRGHRHYRSSWYDDFYYDRASFYDNYGYYYGYFNRIGYLLEGIFYKYDRYYTFRDRVRGKGIFDHRYYRPYIHDDYYDYDDSYYRR